MGAFLQSARGRGCCLFRAARSAIISYSPKEVLFAVSKRPWLLLIMSGAVSNYFARSLFKTNQIIYMCYLYTNS